MIEGISKTEEKLLPIRLFNEADETVRQMAFVEFYNGFNEPVKKGSLRSRIRRVEKWLDEQDVQIIFIKDSMNYIIGSSKLDKQLTVYVTLRMGGTQLGYQYVWHQLKNSSQAHI